MDISTRVTDVCACVQACGLVWLPLLLAAPSLARCCWLTSTPLVPRPSSTPTSTHCKSRFSFCVSSHLCHRVAVCLFETLSVRVQIYIHISLSRFVLDIFVCELHLTLSVCVAVFPTQRGLHGEVCDEQLLWHRPGCQDLPGVQQQARGASREMQVRHISLTPRRLSAIEQQIFSMAISRRSVKAAPLSTFVFTKLIL